MTASEDVRRYYDANTWKFLLAGSQRAIHRELWGPGVTSRSAAAHHAHELVLGEIGQEHRRVLDLGCGVGAAALYVAERRPVEVLGISISPEQVRLAERYAARTPPRFGRVAFREADFTALPADVTGFDMAFAIEAFVHASSAAAFFSEAARALRPGGALITIDDVLLSTAADRRLEDFRSGWKVSSLITVTEAARLAAHAGLELVRSVDLSPLQRLGRPRDRLIRLAQPALRRLQRRSSWAAALVGGDALQQSHLAGLLEYRLLRFTRRPG